MYRTPRSSRHLSAFLESANQVPDAILFNGGFFIPEICRTRVADVLENWYGKRPEIFENRDLDLAVASGAAYYSYVRSTGAGVLVRGGLPRATMSDSMIPRRSVWCRAAPKKATPSRWIAKIFSSWRTNQSRSASSALLRAPTISPVKWFNSPKRKNHQHAPLEAVIRFGKGGERLVPVKLGARLTETGTLETWCDSKISENRWRLQFQLRKSARSDDGRDAAPRRPAAVVSREAVEAASELVRETFKSGTTPPEELPSRIEAALGLDATPGPWT